MAETRIRMTVSDLLKNLDKITTIDVGCNLKRILVTRRGKPAFAVVTLKDLEVLEEYDEFRKARQMRQIDLDLEGY